MKNLPFTTEYVLHLFAWEVTCLALPSLALCFSKLREKSCFKITNISGKKVFMNLMKRMDSQKTRMKNNFKIRNYQKCQDYIFILPLKYFPIHFPFLCVFCLFFVFFFFLNPAFLVYVYVCKYVLYWLF